LSVDVGEALDGLKNALPSSSFASFSFTENNLMQLFEVDIAAETFWHEVQLEREHWKSLTFNSRQVEISEMLTLE